MTETPAPVQVPVAPVTSSTPTSKNPLSALLIGLLLIVLLVLVGAASYLYAKVQQLENKNSSISEVADVVTPPPAPAPDASPNTDVTPTPVPSCSGAPVISSFSVTPNSIEAGQTATLSWGAITNADSAEIDTNVGQIALGGGTQVVSPASTTTYTLKAVCGSSVQTKQVVLAIGSGFTVTSVVSSVSPSTFTGVCPKTFDFSASIKANKAGTVTYRWERSDGATDSDKTLTFTGAATLTVTDSWSKGSSGSGWERVKIISPNAMTSNKAEFNLTCQTPKDFSGYWYHNFGTMNLTQSGASVTGTYYNAFGNANGTIAGTVNNDTLTGTWSINGGSGDLSFKVSSSGNTFDGNWGGSNKWCGAKSGKTFPDKCSFQGDFKNQVGTTANCDMSLSRTNNSVTGTYCNGTVSGTVSYSGSANEALLNGTWKIGAGTTGPFTFYLLGYSAKQFQGNYNTSWRWCGWRSDSSMPANCLR